MGRVGLIMKKIYKTDIGSLIFFFLFGVVVSLFCSYWAIWDSNVPLWIRLITILITALVIFFFFTMLKYTAIITEDSITVKNSILSFYDAYQTIRFDEIEEVYNAPYYMITGQMIIFKPRDKAKKVVSILVGFGLPWDALLDVLERLPKDVKIIFEPELWKRIKKPLLNEKVKKINIIATVVILLSLIWFSYFLWCIFKLHRIPFPINFFLGNPQGRLWSQ